MKTLRKLKIEELQCVLSVLNENQRKTIVGGKIVPSYQLVSMFDGIDVGSGGGGGSVGGVVGGTDDCIWRCIAYYESGGTDYSADAAKSVASQYYGSSFDPNNYTFSGSHQDLNNYISNYEAKSNANYCTGQILVFNPCQISGWDGYEGENHAVIVDGYSSDGQYVNVFDPQSGSYSSISTSELYQNDSNGNPKGFIVNF